MSTHSNYIKPHALYREWTETNINKGLFTEGSKFVGDLL
jgi:hypothetical protein